MDKRFKKYTGDKEKFKIYIGLEKNFQISAMIYLRSIGLLAFHVPNGGNRKRLEAISLKEQGVLPGVSDILILEPSGKYHALIIELKVKGGKVSEAQETFLNHANRLKYKGIVVWGFDELEYEVDKYLNGRD